MNPPGRIDPLTPASGQLRLAAQARVLRGLSAGSQVALMVALIVLWKHYQMPFAQAFEKCFLAGVVIYITLATTASVLMSLARLQPMHLLLRPFLAIVSLVIFGTLHFVYGMGVLKSAMAWALIYLAARVLVFRMESRAMRRFHLG